MNYLIYGFGLSGEWAFKLLLKKKHYNKIFIYDDSEQGREKAHKETKNVPNVYILKGLDDHVTEDVDKVILSPGVSIYDENVKKFFTKEIEIVSELEFAYNYCKKKIVAITGTNGKTTTVKLVNHILNCANRKSSAVGNVGYPLSRAIEESLHANIFVCEVSSFQLEAIKNFRPYISCILNITPDHLNRHGSIENYKRTKLEVARNQTKRDYFITNSFLNLKSKKAQNFEFGRNNLNNGCFCKNGDIYYRFNDKENFVCKEKDINLMGEHNLENVLAALTICKILKVKNKFIVEGLKTFKVDKHRLQKVYEYGGVVFIDDSKATNVDATVRAQQCFKDNNLILLLGGSDKGFNFDDIFKSLPQNTKKVICFGGVREKLVESAKKFNVEPLTFNSLKEATNFCCDIATSNDVVLLSPANASFDEFKNYKDRGIKFLEYIKDFYENN